MKNSPVAVLAPFNLIFFIVTENKQFCSELNKGKWDLNYRRQTVLDQPRQDDLLVPGRHGVHDDVLGALDEGTGAVGEHEALGV